MSLHKRIRPGSEAAPWVCDEVERLEARVKEMEAIKLGLTKTLIEMEADRANNLCHACAHTQNDIGWFRVNLSDDDVRDLLRFRDECHDDGAFTLRSDQTRRFCGMGVMQWRGRAGYSLTSIGEDVLSRVDVLHDNYRTQRGEK